MAVRIVGLLDGHILAQLVVRYAIKLPALTTMTIRGTMHWSLRRVSWWLGEFPQSLERVRSAPISVPCIASIGARSPRRAASDPNKKVKKRPCGVRLAQRTVDKAFRPMNLLKNRHACGSSCRITRSLDEPPHRHRASPKQGEA